MFSNQFKNKKVLITGNTGFKGSWMTMWCLRLGAKVYGMSISVPTKPSMFQILELEKKMSYHEVDVREYVKVKKKIDSIKPDVIFHFAAQPLVSQSYTFPLETISTNVIGTANILHALKESNFDCSVVIITSDKCYDNVEWEYGYKETDSLGGKDIYSGSKGSAELIVQSYFHSFLKLSSSKVKVATGRAGNVIGGGDWAKDRIVPDCMRAWSKQKYVEIRKPNAIRPWQHVLEPLGGYLCLAEHLMNGRFNGEAFNFGPNPTDIYDVKKIINDLSDYWKDKRIEKFYLVGKDEKFYEAGLLKLNCDKALSKLQWVPTLNYQELIEFTSKWYYNFYKDPKLILRFTMNQIEEYENKAKLRRIKWAS